jgi:hypothetical protein
MLLYLKEDISSLYKKILIVGIYNSSTFSQKDREYIFSYVSKKNNCDRCYIEHFQKANLLGFNIKEFDNSIINLVDKLTDDFSYYDDTVDTKLLLQIKCIIAFARFANSMNTLK